MSITVHILNAFSVGPLGGNPAGVVLEADALTPQQKQSIAAQVGLSETAFVSASTTASVKVEFFTPTRQIPHCGHATVAAFTQCRSTGRLSQGLHLKESIAGTLPVQLGEQSVSLHQPYPVFEVLALPSGLAQRCLRALSLEESALAPGSPLVVARSSNAFLLVALASEAVLASIRPVMSAIEALSEELGLIGFYPYVLSSKGTEPEATARMLAPLYGIPEESATGTAAGPLGAWLLSGFGEGASCRVHQGHFMDPPSPSLLQVAVFKPDGDKGEVAWQVRVSGAARHVEALNVEL